MQKFILSDNKYASIGDGFVIRNKWLCLFSTHFISSHLPCNQQKYVLVLVYKYYYNSKTMTINAILYILLLLLHLNVTMCMKGCVKTNEKIGIIFVCLSFDSISDSMVVCRFVCVCLNMFCVEKYFTKGRKESKILRFSSFHN